MLNEAEAEVGVGVECGSTYRLISGTLFLFSEFIFANAGLLGSLYAMSAMAPLFMIPANCLAR